MTKTRIGIAAALLAALALVILLWPRSDTEPQQVAARPDQVETPAVARGPAPATANVRTELPAPASTGLAVLAQDRDKRPIAGAEITVTGDDRDLVFPPTGSDGWTRAQRLPNGDVYLRARRGELVGSTSWRWTSNLTTEVTIWMGPDREVEVTVADSAGAPQPHVQVGLFGGKETEWRNTRLVATTDDAGIAHLHVDGDSWLAANKTMRAVVMAGAGRVAAEPVAWSEPGPTRVALVVEPPAAATGPELLVRFVDQDGAPADVQGKLAWSRIQSAGAGSWEGPAGDMAVAGREAMVSRLLDGDHIRLHLWEEGRLESRLAVTFPAGARRQEATLPRGPAAPRLEIPLVDRDGVAVTTGDYVVTVLLDGGGYERETTMQPDGAGRLVVTLASASSGSVEIAEPRDAGRLFWPVPERLKRPYRTSIGKEPQPNPPLAVRQFARCEAGEVRRLDAVTAPDMAARIVGIVRGEDDQPVPGVRVWLTTVAAPEPEAFAAFATTTDAAGRFAILATSLPDEVFVCGRRPLGFCAPVRAPPSAEPVTLRLQPTGAIALDLRAPDRGQLPEAIARELLPVVTLRVDEDALADGWWAFCRNRSRVFAGQWRDQWQVGAPLPEQGELLFRDLVPGNYQVTASVGVNPVLDLRNVAVVAGATTRPPLAHGGTIGGGVEAGPVHVRDAEGRPLAGARVSVQLREWQSVTPQPMLRNTDANGVAWFVVPRGAVAEVEVVAARSAPVRLQEASLPLDVTIGAGTSLDFVITGQAEATADSRALVVICNSYSGTPPESPLQQIGKLVMFRHPQANLGADGRATIPNLPPGTYRLWLGAVPPLMAKRGHTFVPLGDRTITANDAAHVTVEHAVTAAETATLLAK